MLPRKKLSGQWQWLFAGRASPTSKGQARRDIEDECLESVSEMKFDAVSSQANDFRPTITCYTPTECPQEVVPVVPPVCGNQCKAAGDVGSSCNETGDGSYTCSCSAGF